MGIIVQFGRRRFPRESIRDLNDEQLAIYVASQLRRTGESLKALRPYYWELRERFRRLEPGHRIAGYDSWGSFCYHALHRTRRAVNYLLAGGNHRRTGRETVSRSLASDSEALSSDRAIEQDQAEVEETLRRLFVLQLTLRSVEHKEAVEQLLRSKRVLVEQEIIELLDRLCAEFGIALDEART